MKELCACVTVRCGLPLLAMVLAAALWRSLDRRLARKMTGFERWHFRGRPQVCHACGKRLLWGVGRDVEGRIYRRLRCMTGEGAEGPSDWPHDAYEWFESDEWGAEVWE